MNNVTTTYEHQINAGIAFLLRGAAALLGSQVIFAWNPVGLAPLVSDLETVPFVPACGWSVAWSPSCSSWSCGWASAPNPATILPCLPVRRRGGYLPDGHPCSCRHRAVTDQPTPGQATPAGELPPDAAGQRRPRSRYRARMGSRRAPARNAHTSSRSGCSSPTALIAIPAAVGWIPVHISGR